ncbi:MAG TPA: hypothetical protein VH415_01390 [Nitrososphaeraceae archaeon]|jgi:hypothetical protein
MVNKNVVMKRNSRTKSQREYVKTMIHNLSLQRLTDQEIVQWLHEEKQIEMARSTVTNIRNRIEKSAEKWYIQLKHSRYKYLATYKQRLDSLLSYQKKLHELLPVNNKNPELVIRVISELHRIELSLHTLLKELPDLELDSSSGIEPTATTAAPDYPTIIDPNNPDKRITDPDWIKENLKKVMRASNVL